jgi:hypothetical protein
VVVASALCGAEAEREALRADRHAAGPSTGIRPASNSKLYRWIFGGDVQTEIRFQLPGYRWEIVSNDTARLLTLTCLTPEAPKKTRITQFTWWTGAPLLNLAIPIAKPAGKKFLDQDGTMVNLQNEGMAHQKAMLWIDDIDVQAKWYQRLKREWTEARTEERDFAKTDRTAHAPLDELRRLASGRGTI